MIMCIPSACFNGSSFGSLSSVYQRFSQPYLNKSCFWGAADLFYIQFHFQLESYCLMVFCSCSSLPRYYLRVFIFTACNLSAMWTFQIFDMPVINEWIMLSCPDFIVFACHIGLGSLLKLTGHMQVDRGRIQQVPFFWPFPVIVANWQLHDSQHILPLLFTVFFYLYQGITMYLWEISAQRWLMQLCLLHFVSTPAARK